MKMIAELTQEDFDNYLAGNKLVLIDFFADWCGPCRTMAPVMEELAREFGENFKFGKVNVDTQQALATKFSILSIPTIIIFREAKEAERIIGAVPKSQFAEKLKKYLTGN